MYEPINPEILFTTECEHSLTKDGYWSICTKKYKVIWECPDEHYGICKDCEHMLPMEGIMFQSLPFSTQTLNDILSNPPHEYKEDNKMNKEYSYQPDANNVCVHLNTCPYECKYWCVVTQPKRKELICAYNNCPFKEVYDQTTCLRQLQKGNCFAE